MARSTDGFDSLTGKFLNEASFNVMLPLAVIVVFAFVRWQQVLACADPDQRVRREEAWQPLGVSWQIVLAVVIALSFTYACGPVVQKASSRLSDVVLHCAEAVLGNRNRGEKLEFSYFSAAAVAVVLVMLVDVLYLS